MTQVSVSEFKAICLRLLEEERQTGEPIEILKNGVPLAVVYPAPTATRRGTYGVMKDTVDGEAGDLVTPIEEVEWEGRLRLVLDTHI